MGMFGQQSTACTDIKNSINSLVFWEHFFTHSDNAQTTYLVDASLNPTQVNNITILTKIPHLCERKRKGQEKLGNVLVLYGKFK